MRRIAGRLLAAPALLLAVATLATGVDAVWTEEDVVRGFVAGTSPKVLIEQLGTREVSFTLSPEMLDELRRAGLPEDLIAAMRARQAAIGAAPAAIEPTAPNLRVSLGEGRVVLRVRDEVDPQLAAELELHGPRQERHATDLAVFLACRTGAHVPDRWTSASPLGGDRISMPRHQMLAFASGARQAGDQLELELPQPLEARVETDGSHDLMIGVAARIAGRWYRIESDTWDGAVAGGELRATVRGRGLRKLRAAFDKPNSAGKR